MHYLMDFKSITSTNFIVLHNYLVVPHLYLLSYQNLITKERKKLALLLDMCTAIFVGSVKEKDNMTNNVFET